MLYGEGLISDGIPPWLPRLSTWNPPWPTFCRFQSVQSEPMESWKSNHNGRHRDENRRWPGH